MLHLLMAGILTLTTASVDITARSVDIAEDTIWYKQRWVYHEQEHLVVGVHGQIIGVVMRYYPAHKPHGCSEKCKARFKAWADYK